MGLGMLEEAEAAFARFERLEGRAAYGKVKYLVATGLESEARELIQQLEQLEVGVPELIAEGWEALGDRDRALEWVGRGMREHSGWAPLIPPIRGLRDLIHSSEYRSLADAHGFPIVWDLE